MSARDRTTRDVVTRTLPLELSEGASVPRFQQEIAAAAAVSHPQILPVLTGGMAPDGSLYYQMAFAAGEWLPARMQRGAIPLEESVKILGEIAGALLYAHDQRMVHGSLAPDKIVLSFGSSLITDLGVARAVVRARGKPLVGAHITDEPVLGDPAYLAPEQYISTDIDSAADIYAWGVIAYEMLGGSHPFSGRTSTRELMAAHAGEAPVPLALKAIDLPISLTTLVMACLEKSPSRRPAAADITEILSDRTLLDDSTVTELATPVGTWRQKAIGVGVVVLAGFLAIVMPQLAPRFARTDATADSGAVAAVVIDSAPVVLSLAVLPFTRSADGAPSEYVSEGITRELTRALGRIPGVRLAGATSLASNRLASTSALQVGAALGVGGVVTGSVQQTGTALRVRAQLLNTLTGREMWSASFERPLTELLKLQEDLTAGIVSTVSPVMKGAGATTLAVKSRGTANAAAYDLYLQATRLGALDGNAGVLRSIASLQRALDLDTTFARAAAAQARAYIVLARDSAATRDTALRLASTAAQRALAVDATSPDAHMVLGDLAQTTWKFAEAAAAYEKALLVEPGNPAAQLQLARTLLAAGNVDRALTEARIAMQQDPLSPVAGQLTALALLDARKFAESVLQSRLVIAMDSLQTTDATRAIARAYLFAGSADSAITVLEPLFARDSTAPGIAATLFLGYTAAGRTSDARALRETMLGLATSAPDYDAMVIALTVGNKTAATAALTRNAARGGNIAQLSESIGCDPLFDLLKGEAGYTSLLAQLGVASCAASTPWPVLPPR